VGAFVTSTTRLALPITDLIVLSEECEGDGAVDIVHFSYEGMEDDDSSDVVGRQLGLLMDGNGKRRWWWWWCERDGWPHLLQGGEMYFGYRFRGDYENYCGWGECSGTW